MNTVMLTKLAPPLYIGTLSMQQQRNLIAFLEHSRMHAVLPGSIPIEVSQVQGMLTLAM